jgi:anti-sigma factor RsiW
VGTMQQPNPGEGCPSNAELVELVEGRIEASARGRLKEHLAGCDACAAIVERLAPALVVAFRSEREMVVVTGWRTR